MKTLNRICIKDYEIEDSVGTRFKLKRGKEYLTSSAKKGKVCVFSTYWVHVPVSLFAGERIFTNG